MTREDLKDKIYSILWDKFTPNRRGKWEIDNAVDEIAELFPRPPAEGAETILKEGLDDGRYADITDGINIDVKQPFYQAIIRYAEDVVAAQQQPTAEGAEEILAKGKVLMYGNIIVDPIMLPEGIYATKELRIYQPGTTIEHLIETGKMFRDKTQTQWLPDSYFDNLSKCELIDVDVVRDATLHAQRIAEKMVEDELVAFLIKRDYPHAMQDECVMVMVRNIVSEYLKSRVSHD